VALASITKEEAMFLHQDHYSGPFEFSADKIEKV